MSRKARIAEEEKQNWACVRAWTASKGYQTYKQPKDGYLRDALVVLEHECPEGRNPMRTLAGTAQQLLFGDIDDMEGITLSEFSAVVVVDVSPLLGSTESDKSGRDVVSEEALQPQFGKRLEKPVARFLERLFLRDATIVARGSCCKLAAKLLSPKESRGLKPQHVKRLVMLHPELPPAFIATHLDSRVAPEMKSVELHVVHPSEDERMRIDPALRACYPTGTSLTRQRITASVLLAILVPARDLPPPPEEAELGPESEELALEDEDEGLEYDPERFDNMGMSLFFAELRIVMDPVSKMDVQEIIDVTYELQEPESEDADSLAEDISQIDIADCTPEVGGLVLRGNRCILCRSLEGEWKGMAVPSLQRDEEDTETQEEFAVQAVSLLCDIEETEMKILSGIPPVTIEKPGGRRTVVTMYPLYAANAPRGPLEAADVEDPDDSYDWYTFPRAVVALRRTGDEATVAALQEMARNLKEAAESKKLPVKWGGVFGQEYTGQK